MIFFFFLKILRVKIYFDLLKVLNRLNLSLFLREEGEVLKRKTRAHLFLEKNILKQKYFSTGLSNKLKGNFYFKFYQFNGSERHTWVHDTTV